MAGRAHRRRGTGPAALLASLVPLVASGCGTPVAVRSADEVVAPTFTPVLADPGDSPQLEAVPTRDVGGLEPTVRPVAEELLATALDQLADVAPEVTELVRIRVGSDDVLVSWPDAATSAVVVTAFWTPAGGWSEPSPRAVEWAPSELFAVDAVHPDRFAALVAGVERRFPLVVVDAVELRSALTPEHGVLYELPLVDAQGQLARVYADLDGVVVAVDDA